MTGQRAPFFPHRRNPDGSLTSICLSCCSTVASHKTEEELVEMDKKHVCETALFQNAAVFVEPRLIVGMRIPKVGDRIAIPKHAVIFVVKSVNESKETVDAQIAMEPDRVEKGIPWEKITIIDP